MKKFILLSIAALAVLSACSVTRQVSVSDAPSQWVGFTTMDILDAMGTPDRIDTDGKEGSVLVYESAPDYDDPSFDILDPDATVREREYAYFYLDDEGTCYRVESNKSLPAAPRINPRKFSWLDAIDWMIILPIVIVIELL